VIWAILVAGKRRWTRGHAIWVSDVFAWRGSPAAWNEELLWVTAHLGPFARVAEAEAGTVSR
jgi:hypothetical protein